MRRILKGVGAGLLFLAVAICFAPTVVMPVLDFRYYEGPESDHFDGERFFNLYTPPAGGSPGLGFFLGKVGNEERAVWPERLPVTQTVPPARVEGEAMKVTWIGHATVLIQTAGLNILTDPIWSERASPVSFLGPKRARDPGVAFEGLPKIDLVLVSHNHYDHMDLATLKRLWERDMPVIATSLGNDTILKNAGVQAVALDWRGRLTLPSGVSVIVQSNHHWSTRWRTDYNRALWSAFTVRLPSGNIYFAGDTGYGDGAWVKEAADDGPYRLAILPIGAYAPRSAMKDNHMNPEEAMAVYRALGAKSGLGMHWGTFQLTFEPIDEPVQRLAALRKMKGAAASGFIATEVGRSWDVPALR
jgi:L-ascorbate metabolism protein UlaG (beta-lactamase superfamily)